ncbi:MAG: DUF1549 domain-containing protein [Phycisphaerae bacterium]
MNHDNRQHLRGIRARLFAGSALTVLVLAGAPSAARAGVASLAVYPSPVQLDSATDRQQIVVVATMADGTTRDVTAGTQFAFGKPGLARIEKDVLLPVADGTAPLQATYGGQSTSVEISVRNAVLHRPASFRLDVEPALMRAGCNSGTCHGAASGKNGFRLSLFGFDPAADYVRLTRQTHARRVDVADPGGSLILQKPATIVAHEGGRCFAPGDPYYSTIERWIAEGAHDDPKNLPALTGIEVLPPESVLAGAGATQQLLVRATYSDGADRDVTHLAVTATDNDRSATIDDRGVVTAGARGEAHIMVRYGVFAEVAHVIVLPAETAFTWPDVPANNYIDQRVYVKLRKLRITPSAVCGDAVFLRRVYIDLVGGLPTVAEYDRFVSDQAPDKRARLIDELLKRPEFPEIWAMKWAELLRIESGSRRISFKAMFRYNNWLRDAILTDMPMNRMVRTLLTAGGGNFANPAANFYMVETDPKSMAENVAQVFLGIRVQCAQCHNHPFERWTMDDYYSFAAFFAQVGRKTAEDPRETIVFNSGSGEVRHLRGGRPMAPKFLGGETPKLAGRDRRTVLADWLTGPDNPWFARCFVNRVWAHFMGRGIVDPVDDVRVSNPPSNPALLDALAARFIEYNYDLRKLVRDIGTSRTYQLATQSNATNAGDDRNFAHALIRRIPAEQLLDAICQVTERPEKFRGLPLGARAVQVADGRTGNYFLDTFGRPDRTSACACDRRNEPTLGQALHLINGATISGKIASDQGRAARLVANKKTIDQIADELYVAALSRRPTAKELAAAKKRADEVKDLRRAAEDLFWAVLNSREFVFNH